MREIMRLIYYERHKNFFLFPNLYLIVFSVALRFLALIIRNQQADVGFEIRRPADRRISRSQSTGTDCPFLNFYPVLPANVLLFMVGRP